ncbi:hypothetical protein Tco_0624624 [Tanacetum coccineum]|uniref:Transposase (putative) gypsy type domain-containing protein n=1 Tax=Tanacetum coccineum TaxID=301880 RepID=A0ABQ4WEG5_9ASTR
MSKNDMKNRICTLSKNDLKDLVKTYRIPLDLHPRLPDPGFTMDHLPSDAIGIYSEFLWFFGVRIPFSTFLLSVLKYFKVHISQLVPLGLNKVVSFEVVCRDLNIVPTVTLFRVFQYICKQGDWFSFSKHRNTEDVCMDDGPSSLKKWKDKFFLIDRRAIPDYLTWRHSCSCVLDDLPSDGYDRNDVELLCPHLICLREIRDEVLIRSGLSDAKVVEESYHLSSPLLERVPSHTTTPAAEGAMILLPTPNEIAASLPDPRLAIKKEEAEEKSFEGWDEGTSTRFASAPTPRLGKRLGAPPSMAVVSASGPSHVGTSVHASTSGRSFSPRCAAVSGHAGKSGAEIPEDDFGTATRGEEIDLTLFPLTPSPYQMSYPYEGAYSPPYTKEEWNGPHAPEDNILCKDIFKDPLPLPNLRELSLCFQLDLSNRFNILSALLEKFDWKAGYVKVLRSEVTTLDGKLERMQKDCDALGQENRELNSQKDVASVKVKELQTELTDAMNQLALEKAKSQGYKDAVDGLREEVTRFVGSGVESLVQKLLSSDKFHAALAHVASLGINYCVGRGLRMGRTDAEFEVASQKVSNFHIGAKADFDKALVDFPTTPFPFLGKIVAAAGGTLPDVTQVLPDKHIRSVTYVPVAPPIANEDANQVPLEHASDDSVASI